MILNVIGKSVRCIFIMYYYILRVVSKSILCWIRVWNVHRLFNYWAIQILNLRPSAHYCLLARRYVIVYGYVACTLRKECVSVLLCISHFLVLKQRVISIKKKLIWFTQITIVRNHLFYLLQNSELYLDARTETKLIFSQARFYVFSQSRSCVVWCCVQIETKQCMRFQKQFQCPICGYKNVFCLVYYLAQYQNIELNINVYKYGPDYYSFPNFLHNYISILPLVFWTCIMLQI